MTPRVNRNMREFFNLYLFYALFLEQISNFELQKLPLLIYYLGNNNIKFRNHRFIGFKSVFECEIFRSKLHYEEDRIQFECLSRL
jgi:hypothetical protein